MTDTGYTTRPVSGLSIADLLEEALQSDYDSGYYAAKPGDHLYARLGQVAIDRRDQCFNELKRRLEAYGQLEGAVSRLLQHRKAGNEHPIDWQRLIEAWEAINGN